MGGGSSKTKQAQGEAQSKAQRTAAASALGAAGSGGEEDRGGGGGAAAAAADNHPDTQADNTQGGEHATPKSKLTVEEAEAKATLLPEGKPPEEVWRWIDDHGTGQATANDEAEHKGALAWLQAAFPLAHKDDDIKRWIKRLLAVEYFTSNMNYMGIFTPLQDFCAARLDAIGAPLRELYRTDEGVRELAGLAPALLPAVREAADAAEAAGAAGAGGGRWAHLRQDHPAVGLAAPACCDMTTFKGESTYIHVLRILARLLNGKFQAMVERVVAPYGGKHKSCNIKGDQRMRNKANSADDHRYEAKPRPALNIDIVRCCATFGTVAALRDGVAALVAAVSRGELGGTSGSGSGSGSGAAGGDRVAAGGGVGRVKNGFAVAEAVAAKSFHYRSFMLNLVVNFGSTLGELCATPEAARVFDAYVNDWKERNPGVPWGTWRAEAQAAVDALRTSMAQVRAVMVCEVQCLLAPYLAARKEMHLLYKVVRAASDKHLTQQFLVAKEEEGRAEGATWASEEPIRYHFWMQEYRAQYITILSGASRAVKSTIKTPFFAYNLEKLLGNQKHPHAKCDTFPLQITRLPKCREWSVLKPWLSFNMSKTLLQNASLGPKRRLLKISIHIANNPICQWLRYWQYAILPVTIIVLGQYGCCPY